MWNMKHKMDFCLSEIKWFRELEAQLVFYKAVLGLVQEKAVERKALMENAEMP